MTGHGAGHGDHGHSHGPALAAALSAGGRHRSRLAWAFGLILAFFVVEVAAGLYTRSLALLSDAGHMLTDVIGLGMALAAIQAARAQRPSVQRSFGVYRLEILAALANAVLLFGVALFVLWEAVRRLQDPPEVLGVPLLLVAVAGLAVNVAAFLLLREGSKESLNVEGAYLEVLADMFGSIGVVVAAVVLATTGWPYIDPMVAVGIGLFILPRTWRLGRHALRILLQAAPPEIDLDALRGELAAIDDVVDVHDLHVWTLTSAMEVASVHLMTCTGADPHRVLDQARHLLSDRYHIDHATLQVEPDTHQGCESMTW
ncbi:MAG: cation diffusion facilitator family transporter [Egibacteraceae bacterium]